MRKTTQPYWVIVIDFELFQNLSMKIVIIGGVAAGAKGAAKSRRLLPDAEISIYTQDTHVSFSACGLPYYIEGIIKNPNTLIIREPEDFKKQNINIHLN